MHYVSIDTSTDFPNAPEGETGDGHFSFLPAGHFAPNGTYMKVSTLTTARLTYDLLALQHCAIPLSLQWLEADLAAAQANPSTRWIVAGGHRPFEDLDNANAQEVAALFKKYGVAFYFAGHGHRCVVAPRTPPPPLTTSPLSVCWHVRRSNPCNRSVSSQLLALQRRRVEQRRHPHHGRRRWV